MTDPTHAYVASKDGTVRAVVAYYPDAEAQYPALLAGWCKIGRTVELLPINEAFRRFDDQSSHE